MQSALVMTDQERSLSKISSTELLHDLVQSIVSALEARDPRTARHSLRVGDMTERTCIHLGLSSEETIAIHMAAHVHDVGKIGLPDSVLHKNARLTKEEHDILRCHPCIGAEIVGKHTSLKEVANIVLHHHESWDGLGYPNGLSGYDIPLGSRIISVCDSIDAMLGKRVHSKPISEVICKGQIFSGIGTKYDPRVALTVLSHWDEIVGPIDFEDKGNEPALPCQNLSCSVPETPYVLTA